MPRAKGSGSKDECFEGCWLRFAAQVLSAVGACQHEGAVECGSILLEEGVADKDTQSTCQAHHFPHSPPIPEFGV